ncbi:MAG TPA: polysaccharide biosynthesis tyrosine autokinase [Candidatus Ozemobacteraceae bacterium]
MAQENLFEGILRSLHRHRGAAVMIVGATLLVTALVSRFYPTLYESRTLLRVMASELGRGDSPAAVMNGILSQKAVATEVLRTCGLDLGSEPRYTPFCLEDAGQGLVSLTVRDSNPARLPELGDAVIRTLSERFLGYSGETGEFEIEMLEKKKGILREKLDTARKAVLDASRVPLFQNDAMAIEEEMQVIGTRLQDDKKRLLTLPRIRVIPSSATEDALAETRDALAAARSELKQLLETYREKHPKVIAAQERITNLQARQRRLSSQRDRKEANPEFETLQQEIARSEARLEELKNKWLEANRTPALQAAGGAAGEPAPVIEARIKSLEGLYSETLMRLEELQIRKSSAVGRIQVLRKDIDAPRPIGLSLFQRELVAILSGALLAVFLLYTPAPMKAELIGTPAQMLQTMLPAPGGQVTEPGRLLEMSPLSAARLALPVPDSIQHASYDERLIVLNEPNSRRLEPYKALVSNLQIALSESGTRIIHVCSSRSGMGRSTLTANLAILFAQAGYSTILIDANLRRPVLHRVFDTDNTHGLGTALFGHPSSNLVKQTMIKNLGLITAGPIPPSPAELLGSVSMIELLETLKRRVELVLIDTPALLEYPDAGILAGQAGGVIFLHRDGEPEADLKASREFLKNIRANILGYVTT